ncbi:ABC transporter ATP-binding protein [Deinococcus alpinitundrae]|uniref:ABC transporter ATP-binding protein n=1 Tax=Deinococcus alpinitundrae TaxID=468913 RepID=UPI00137B6E2E|nr:ABC transporter ATP-binding protein [Deinococcus alpinitundrae]
MSRVLPALETAHLSRHYGAVAAAKNVSLSLAAGETLALLGPSGSGKSTVLRMVAGLERPDTGRVSTSGRDVTRLPPEARNLGLVFQDYALFPHLRVLDNVAYGPRRRGAGRAQAEQQAREALALVGLAELTGRRISELSGGQQQRVALARALAPRPPLLLLDEPLSNLDEQLRAHLRAELRSLFGTLGTAVLLVTHDQREALALADQVALMRAGRVVQVGAAARVFGQPATAWVAEFLGQPNVFARGDQAVLVPESAVVLGEGEAHRITFRQPDEHGETVKATHPLGELTLHLSRREAALIGGGTLRLRLDERQLRQVPDDRAGP